MAKKLVDAMMRKPMDTLQPPQKGDRIQVSFYPCTQCGEDVFLVFSHERNEIMAGCKICNGVFTLNMGKPQ